MITAAYCFPDLTPYCILAPRLLRRYVSNDDGTFLEPVPRNWLGRIELPASCAAKLQLRRLPIRWGAARKPLFEDRLEALRMLDIRPIRARDRPDRAASSTSSVWQVDQPIDPRRWNYLFFETACVWVAPTNGGSGQATLRFAPPGLDIEQSPEITFAIDAESVRHPYLIPISSSPGWSWRPTIDRLRLRAPAESAFESPKIECWRVDDLNPRCTVAGILEIGLPSSALRSSDPDDRGFRHAADGTITWNFELGSRRPKQGS